MKYLRDKIIENALKLLNHLGDYFIKSNGTFDKWTYRKINVPYKTDCLNQLKTLTMSVMFRK